MKCYEFSGNWSAAGCMLVAVLLATPTSAQQFSADLVARNGAAVASVGTLRVSGGKARIETTAFLDGFFLVDAASPAAYFVRPGAHIFMDAKQSSPLPRMFVPVDPADPCRQWQAMAELAAPLDRNTWHCERGGEELVAGHKTDVYRITAPGGFGFVGWIDRDRRFPVQIKTADGAVISADHIRDEPQSAQSFEIPVGSRKLDPQALIRRIQQSDVWVAPPPSQ